MSKSVRRAGLAVCVGALGLTAAGQTAALVKDLNPTPVGPLLTTPQYAARSGDMVFFWGQRANTGGGEPWVTDGTPEGTRILLDINPVAASFDAVTPGFGTVAGGVVFAASDAARGRELYFSDGTTAGTHLVRDLSPGPQNGVFLAPESVGEIAVFGGQRPGAWGIWRTDGTEGGTSALVEFTSGQVTSTSFTRAGSNVYFTLQGALGDELWQSDGTVLGTHIVLDISPGVPSSSPLIHGVCGSRLFFTATRGATGRELWVTDGVATSMVTELRAGTGGIDILAAASDGERLYFSYTPAPAATGREVWVTDGTAAGTVLAADVWPGSSGSQPVAMFWWGGRLWFVAGLSDGRHFFSLDAAGTLTDLGACGLPANLNPGFFGSGGAVFFQNTDAAHGRELWRSDGTAAGTAMVLDATPGPADSDLDARPGSRFGFAADQAWFQLTAGGVAQWYSTDGTVAGTTPFAAFPTATGGSVPVKLTGAGGELFFAINERLYATDGSEAGTRLVRTFSADPLGLGEYAGTLYFSAPGTANPDRVLWRSDGTAAGTVECPLGGGLYNPGPICVVGGRIVTSSSSPVGQVLISTDGTTEGTQILRRTSLVEVAAVTPGHLLYSDDVPGQGREFFASDGTAAGTVQLADIFPGTGEGASPAGTGAITSTGDRFYFIGREPNDVRAMWTSDGTVAGTVRMGTLARPQKLTGLGGKCYFENNPSDAAHGLWVAEAGVGMSLVRAFPPVGGLWRSISFSTTAASKLYFTLQTESAGMSLYSSDGTAEGTVEVAEVWPNNFSNMVIGSVGPEGPAYVSAATPGNGWELYRTSGEPGSLVAIEADPGPASSAPIRAAVAGDRFYFVATDALHGQELWTIRTSELRFPPACPPDFNGDGFLDFFDYDDYVHCFESGACPPGKTADYNGDGFADFFDYDDFVGGFEAGC